MERAGANKSQPVTLLCCEDHQLPVPYPAYPYNLLQIYPELQGSQQVQSSSMTVTSSVAMGYRPLAEYPDFIGLYPSDPWMERVGENKSQPVALGSAVYPFLTIYPPVYPSNLVEIYGPCHTINASIGATVSSESISTRLPVYSGYPNFDLCRSISLYLLGISSSLSP